MKTAKVMTFVIALLSSVIFTGAAESQSLPKLTANDKFSISSPGTPEKATQPTRMPAKFADQVKVRPGPEDYRLAAIPKADAYEPAENNKQEAVARPYPKLGVNPLISSGLNEENALSLNFKKLEKFKGLQPGEGEEIKQALAAMVEKKKFNIVWVGVIYQNGQPVAQYSEIMERGYRITEDRAPTWEGKEPAVEIRLKRGVIVHIFLECGNPGIYIPRIAAPKKPKLPQKPFESIPGTPPLAEPPKLTKENKWKLTPDADLWGGIGIYESLRPRKGANNKGYYWWTRGHLLPLGYQFNDNTSVHFGGYVFAAGGGGKSGNYKYSWNELFYGPSVKLYMEHSDLGLDVGMGVLRNRGFEKLYKSAQWEKDLEANFHFNYHPRRDEGKKLLPKIEANVQGRMALSRPKHDHSWNGERLTPKAWNNNFVDVNLLVHLYDLEPHKHFLVTPGLNLDLGRDFGVQKNFLKIGPALTFTAYGEQVAILYPPNFKFEGKGGDQVHWVSFSFSADAVIKAIYRANTKEVVGSMTPDGYKGSVLAKQFRNGNGKTYANVPEPASNGTQIETVPEQPQGVMTSKGSVLQRNLQSAR
jgi:hypothetical protein